MPVKVGLEVDWIPGREEEIARLIGDRPWDYIIGSVHFIGDRGVDHDGYDIWLTSSPGRGVDAATSRRSATRPRAGCSTCSRIPTS